MDVSNEYDGRTWETEDEGERHQPHPKEKPKRSRRGPDGLKQTLADSFSGIVWFGAVSAQSSASSSGALVC